MVQSVAPSQSHDPSVGLHDEVRQRAFALRSKSGIQISALANGSVQAIECEGVFISQVIASPTAGGIARIYLRAHRDGAIQCREIGPNSSGEFSQSSDQIIWRGVWNRIRYQCA